MGSLARRVLVSNDAERKRLERALHDGPQQRLVAATTTLGLALRRLEMGEDGATELLEQVTEEARLCLEELRDLARDIYPTVLAERGLPSALNDLARRAPGVVEVEAAPEERLPEAVELTAYLVVSEALAGLADGAEAVVSARLEDATLVVDVGGASVDEDQLPGLANRVAGLDGRIEGSTGAGAEFVRVLIPVP
jgi:signal transduction histidine kinase